MSIQLKLRRGTTAQHSTFTGAEGEVTVDTTKDTLVVHDGATPGGTPLLKENNPNYTGTLTGGTGVVNLGSGQFYKDASGNVGIGTNAPSYEVDIQNTGDVTLRVKSLGTGGDDDAQLFLDAYGTGGEPGVYLQQDGSNVSLIEHLNGDLHVSNEVAGNLIFRTGGTERARIDSSGIVTGTAGNLMLVSGTAVSASSTSVNFTGIPSWAKRVTVMFNELSSNGTSTFIIQLGDSGGIEDTLYTSTLVGVAASTNGAAHTSGFGVSASAAANAYSGQAIISLQNGSTNTWTYTSTVTSGSTTLQIGGGSKALSSTLTQLRITTVGGTNTFDGGSINILFE